MTYLVNKTDGTLLARIFDGQTDSPTSPTGHSSITLIGKQVSNYGELQNENFVHILENFSNVTEPTFPLEGQLWWNKDINTMNVFDGTAWYTVTGFVSSTTPPVSPRAGDQWWDASNQQYKIYSGTDWILVGPTSSALTGKSGTLVEVVYDSSTFSPHNIVSVYSNGARFAILSNVASFTPNVAITGFATINPGITFNSTIDAVKLYGTATNADTVGNISPTQFLRNDIDSGTSQNLTIGKHVKIGLHTELDLSTFGGDSYLRNVSSNGNMYINANVGGVDTTALTVIGSTGQVEVTQYPATVNGIATKGYVDTNISNLNSATSGALIANIEAVTNLINSNTATLQSEITAANVQIALRAPIDSPAFTGVPSSVTPLTGDNSSNIATTAFVRTAINSFDATKIYNGTTYVVTHASDIQLVVSGTGIITVDSTGMHAATQSLNDNSTKVATTAYVDRAASNFILNSIAYNPTCYVSSATPNNAVGNDGDIWFQYQ